MIPFGTTLHPECQANFDKSLIFFVKNYRIEPAVLRFFLSYWTQYESINAFPGVDLETDFLQEIGKTFRKFMSDHENERICRSIPWYHRSAPWLCLWYPEIAAPRASPFPYGSEPPSSNKHVLINTFYKHVLFRKSRLTLDVLDEI